MDLKELESLEGKEIIQNVIKALEVVRSSGLTNMFDMHTVKEILDFAGYENESNFISQCSYKVYINLLVEMGKQRVEREKR